MFVRGIILGTLILSCASSSAFAGLISTFGPTPFLQAGDAPAGFGPYLFEDFEDGRCGLVPDDQPG